MSLSEITARAKQNISLYRPPLNSLTRSVAITTLCAALFIIVGAIAITAALICLKLPGVGLSTLSRVLIPAAAGMLSSVPLILISRADNKQAQELHSLWVDEVVTVLNAIPKAMAKKERKDAIKALLEKSDGQYFNQRLGDDLKTHGFSAEGDMVKAFGEVVADFYKVKSDDIDHPDDSDDEKEAKDT